MFFFIWREIIPKINQELVELLSQHPPKNKKHKTNTHPKKKPKNTKQNTQSKTNKLKIKNCIVFIDRYFVICQTAVLINKTFSLFCLDNATLFCARKKMYLLFLKYS